MGFLLGMEMRVVYFILVRNVAVGIRSVIALQPNCLATSRYLLVHCLTALLPRFLVSLLPCCLAALLPRCVATLFSSL